MSTSPLDDLFAEQPSARAGQPMFQMIDPFGELTLAGEQLGVSVELAQELYRDMVLARRLDKEALALQRQGELSLWLMSWGQEAAQVGSIRALAPRTWCSRAIASMLLRCVVASDRRT